MKAAVAVLLLVVSTPALADETCGKGASSTVLTVVDWTIAPESEDTNLMTETLAYSGAKPVRMIDGSIRYGDILEGRIASKAIDRDAHISPGSSYVQSGLWGPFTFERILDMNRDDVTVVACVEAVVYGDGSKETFE